MQSAPGLSKRKKRSPGRTGMGLFVHRLVEEDRLEAHLRDHFHDAKASRERWHYESLGPLPTVEASETVMAAGELIEETLGR